MARTMYRMVATGSGPLEYAESFHDSQKEAIDAWHRTGYPTAYIRLVIKADTQQGWAYVAQNQRIATA